MNIESLASISKSEMLSNFKSPENLNLFILENEAYPGYYESNNLPVDDFKTKSLFLLIQGLDSFHIVKLYRIIFKIKEQLDFDCDISPSVIELYNYQNQAIRLRLEDSKNISEIKSLFEKEGIKFLKKKRIGKYESLIHIKKFVQMEYVEQDIYLDMQDNNASYIALPHVVEMNELHEITMAVKNNNQLKMFDAARCTILTPNGIKDFVRVYAKGGYPHEQLKVLKEKFHQQTNEYIVKNK